MKTLYISAIILACAGCLTGQAISNQWFVYNGTGFISNPNQSEVECYQPANVGVGGGLLTITADYQTLQCGSKQNNLSTYNYTSGWLSSNTFSFTYGTIVFRAKFPNPGGFWSAVWLKSSTCQLPFKTANDVSGGCVSPGNEIDVVEVYGGSTSNVQQTSHVVGGSDTCNVSVGDITQFHTYTTVWTSTSVTFSIDGSTTCTASIHVPTGPLYPIFDIALGGLGGTLTPADFPGSMVVDYIRICSSTATLCNNGDGTMIFQDEFSGTGPQSDVYVGESFSGNATGLDCADPFGVLNNVQTSWINNPGYWTNGIIGPGTTLHLCGTIPTQLNAQGSGQSGLPVTFKVEPGGSLTCGSNCINANGNSYIQSIFPTSGFQGLGGQGTLIQ